MYLYCNWILPFFFELPSPLNTLDNYLHGNLTSHPHPIRIVTILKLDIIIYRHFQYFIDRRYKILKTNLIIKYLLIFVGSISLVLGFIGIFLPILPTTPFLLLASFCFIRSSKPLYHWLINHKLFGTYIYNYITYRAVKRGTKIGALIFLWSTLSISILTISSLHLRILLVSVGVAVSIHLFTLKTL